MARPEEVNAYVRFFIWILKVVFLMGLIVLSAWLASLPKKPTSTISALVVGNSNNTISYLLEIQNPNDASGIYYDDVVVTFLLGQDKVGEKAMGGFYQGTGKTKKMNDSVSADRKVMEDHAGDFSTGRAELNVTLVTRIRYKTWGRKSKHHDLKLQGRVPVGSDGKIRGKKKKIKLHHASKKWRRIKLD